MSNTTTTTNKNNKNAKTATAGKAATAKSATAKSSAAKIPAAKTPAAKTASTKGAQPTQDVFVPQGATRPQGTRIFAQGVEVSNDTWITGLNNNDLVIGPTGSGKTRYHIMPNLMQMNESFIVADTKGNLVKKVGPMLRSHGYDVHCIDFTNTLASFGYNPLDYVRTDAATGKPREQDIMKIANVLVPIESNKDPFWDYAARNFASVLLGLVLEGVRPADRHLGSVATLLAHCKPRENTRQAPGETEQALDDFSVKRPCSFTARKWMAFRPTAEANRMYASILGILSEKLDPFTFDGALKMFSATERVSFRELGQRKTAVFLNISDTDRSLDKLVNLCYAQALQDLCDFADNECPGSALPVPVRMYLDDFATNCVIPDFDNIISTIRSRNIAVTIVLQSITQLETMYSRPQAATIVNGCDHWLYLGGQDVETAQTIAVKANRAVESILNMPAGDIWFFEGHSKARKVKRYELDGHALYGELPEAQGLQI